MQRSPQVKLVIVGDGPLRDQVIRASEENSNICYHGQLEHAQAMKIILKARFLIYPTLYYETFGRSIIESYACGVPVVVSNIGAAAELVRDGGTGLLVRPGDEEDIAEKSKTLWNDQNLCKKMGKNARQEFITRYTPEKNYAMLIDIYQSVIGK